MLNNASDASIKTDIAEVREEIEAELFDEYTNDDVIASVLKATDKTVKKGDKQVLTKKGNSVDIGDLWVEEIEYVTPTDNYVGYYADIDDNGTVDGIIYADLAHAKSGKWNYKEIDNNNKVAEEYVINYQYTTQTNLKNYYIKPETHTDDFGTKQVIAPVKGTKGNDRFYVMTLDDLTQGSNSQFYWYYMGWHLNDLAGTVEPNYDDFGQGKLNTIDAISDWNNKKYGDHNARDIWGVIQDGQYQLVENDNDSTKWFVPSKAEWTAFVEYLCTELGVTQDNYKTYGLSDWYWSSTPKTTRHAYRVDFSQRWCISGCNADGGSGRVRLSATF